MELFLESFWPMFRAGLTVSVPLMLVSFALGLVLAFIIALMRMSKAVSYTHLDVYKRQALLCTTDDPVDDLRWHERLAADDTMETKVLPCLLYTSPRKDTFLFLIHKHFHNPYH